MENSRNNLDFTSKWKYSDFSLFFDFRLLDFPLYPKSNVLGISKYCVFHQFHQILTYSIKNDYFLIETVTLLLTKSDTHYSAQLSKS